MNSFDVIVVGSGSSGGALAGRLSENSDRSVLVIDGGPMYTSRDQLPPELLSPVSMAAAAPGHDHNWAYMAEMRPGLSFPYPRGKGMGGSSSINGCYFIRGTREDFAQWVELGNHNWSYDKVLPYFKRLETDHDYAGENHGSTGPIPVKREPADRAPLFTEAFDAACDALGFKKDPDKNDPAPGGGVGPVPMNIENGQRIGTALGYLLPAVHRPNLTFVGRAPVTRVLIKGNRAIGVEARVGRETRQFFGSEIVLSAGALRSPHILMHSGVGPSAHLRGHGIATVVDLPGVGQNLTDHPMVSATWASDLPLEKMMDRGVLTSVLHWADEGSELEILPFVAKGGDMLSAADVMKRPMRALHAMRGTSLKAMTRQARAFKQALVGIIVLQEDSRGAVTLASGDPTNMPTLQWNLLRESADRRRFRAAVRTAQAVYEADAMREIRGEIVGLSPATVRDDATLDRWVADRIGSGHPSGTCRMGDDEAAVVDQDLRVHGVEGLRVVDTSIFPAIPTRGPNATAIMVGERAADLIASNKGA